MNLTYMYDYEGLQSETDYLNANKVTSDLILNYRYVVYRIHITRILTCNTTTKNIEINMYHLQTEERKLSKQTPETGNVPRMISKRLTWQEFTVS